MTRRSVLLSCIWMSGCTTVCASLVGTFIITENSTLTGSGACTCWSVFMTRTIVHVWLTDSGYVCCGRWWIWDGSVFALECNRWPSCWLLGCVCLTMSLWILCDVISCGLSFESKGKWEQIKSIKYIVFDLTYYYCHRQFFISILIINF